MARSAVPRSCDGRRPSHRKERETVRKRGSSAQTKAEVLRVARELFAQRGVAAVTMRDIGNSAGVDHSLIHVYFGTKEELVEAILRAEFERASALPAPVAAPDFESLRSALGYFLCDGRSYLRLIARAELDGFAPERLLDPSLASPLRLLAQTLAAVQARTGRPKEQLPDPDLVAAVLGGAVFSFATLEPWLTSALRLAPDAFEARRDELLDILVGLVMAACE